MSRPVLRRLADLSGLSFAAKSSMPYLAIRHYFLAMLPTEGEVDFNHLARWTAVRFYCEYRTRERIHRNVADLRLLAIPASWGRVADPNPN